MLDVHYVTPRLCALYDTSCPWSRDRQFYLDVSRGPGIRVLDMGCGTGLVASAIARCGNRVTGVDPAREMLDVARARPGGDRVEWVQSSAEEYESATRYDLIIMTGNAFQALVRDDQVLAFFRHSRNHLQRGGRVVFEARNPALSWPAMWNYSVDLETEEGVVRETREFVGMEGSLMLFDLHYEFPDEALTSRSRIRFWQVDEVARLAGEAGLRHLSLYGDWDRRDFDHRQAREMVFVFGVDDPGVCERSDVGDSSQVNMKSGIGDGDGRRPPERHSEHRGSCHDTAAARTRHARDR